MPKIIRMKMKMMTRMTWKKKMKSSCWWTKMTRNQPRKTSNRRLRLISWSLTGLNFLYDLDPLAKVRRVKTKTTTIIPIMKQTTTAACIISTHKRNRARSKTISRAKFRMLTD